MLLWIYQQIIKLHTPLNIISKLSNLHYQLFKYYIKLNSTLISFNLYGIHNKLIPYLLLGMDKISYLIYYKKPLLYLVIYQLKL